MTSTNLSCVVREPCRRNDGRLPPLLAAGKPFPSNTVRAKALPPPRRSAGLPARRFRCPHHRTRTLHDSAKIIQYPSDRFSEMDIFRKKAEISGWFLEKHLVFSHFDRKFRSIFRKSPLNFIVFPFFAFFAQIVDPWIYSTKFN
ncbi:MAG: hypothetical protein ACLS8O_05860 [Alistipes sp.]|uniref:hypothetical protein n=1 Tax=Alistipes sp. TaxID=1872444 RepID=UPI003990EB08